MFAVCWMIIVCMLDGYWMLDELDSILTSFPSVTPCRWAWSNTWRTEVRLCLRTSCPLCVLVQLQAEDEAVSEVTRGFSLVLTRLQANSWVCPRVSVSVLFTSLQLQSAARLSEDTLRVLVTAVQPCPTSIY